MTYMLHRQLLYLIPANLENLQISRRIMKKFQIGYMYLTH